MDNYIQITFSDIQIEQQEFVIAFLSETGYEGFEENEKELKAFIPEKKFDNILLKGLADKYKLSFSKEKIETQNWNAIWESNFDPVTVDDFVAIRADFHSPANSTAHDIIITPKMSFGTGHHATTHMMIHQMRNIDFAGKSVLDFGTGTGVLAILSEKLGAARITAIDNDEWSIENASENIEKNKCSAITLIKTDSIPPDDRFDIILANINKNFILDNFIDLTSHLNNGGCLLLSGFLTGDEPEISDCAGNAGFAIKNKEDYNNWLCISVSQR